MSSLTRRTFLKLTAAASAALLGLKPKAKPERVVSNTKWPTAPLTQEMLDDFIINAVEAELEYGGYLVPPEIAPQVKALLDSQQPFSFRVDMPRPFVPFYDVISMKTPWKIND